MVRIPAVYLWPGLPQLWRRGSWWGLALAIGCGMALNALLMATWVWIELVGPALVRLGWFLLASVWIVSAVVTAWYGWGVAPRRTRSATAMFREALGEYLQENWYEAERILGELLAMQPRDVEARLMLATLLRHTGRLTEASEQLQRVALLADARRWTLEIENERQMIAEMATAAQQSQGVPEPEEKVAAAA
jgi:uncharacterized protein HemY